jgi:DNA-binding NtrC family response regulator
MRTINNAIEMKEENLNIEWWHKRMILYALKKFDTQQEAADALGCSTRHLIRKKREYYEDKLQDK